MSTKYFLTLLFIAQINKFTKLCSFVLEAVFSNF